MSRDLLCGSDLSGFPRLALLRCPAVVVCRSEEPVALMGPGPRLQGLHHQQLPLLLKQGA